MANLPEKKFRAGAISATIWRNIGHNKRDEEVSYHTVQLDRRYKGKDDVWKSTNSLRISDIPKAILVLQKSYEYLSLKDTEKTEEIPREF